MDKKSYVADKALEAMLQASASDMEDKVVEDLLEGYDGENHEFSEKHKNDMQSLLRSERKRRIYNSAKTYGKRVAIIFVLVIAISTVTVVSVSAWRIKVMNFITEMTKQDTNITIDQDGLESNTYTNNEITFNYIPKGFIIEKSEYREEHIYLEFKNDNEYFNFRTMNIGDSLSIDTEDAHVKEFTMGGRRALYSENDNISILVWHDEELMYVLTGNISEKELIKIAENIKK